MVRRISKWLIAGAVLLATGLLIAWATSPDPKGNPASLEDSPLETAIAPLSDAATLASYRTPDGQVATVLVSELVGDTVAGVDLATLGADRTGNPLRDLGSIAWKQIDNAMLEGRERVSLKISDLLPSAPGGERHIGTGTNFPEHAEEASSDAVFRFPKFGRATPARTTVRAQPGILLDYEVELCMRFDRDIASLEDFDDAIKGVFLCGDFTNRNALVELADPDNLDSGFGFSDAKSGTDSYPSGPFVVVPRDWKSFVDQLRMTTSVNGEPRQDARGEEMTQDFRQLVEASLADMNEARFYYGGDFYKLSDNRRIPEDMTVMSGTSEGVIFAPPARADYIEGAVQYLGNGGPFSGTGIVDSIKQRFIANELRSGHFLQPGDVVRHDSNLLGNIEVEVIAQ